MDTDLAVAFFAGLFVEAAAVFWTHFSERGRAFLAALCSAAMAVSVVLGVERSIRSVSSACLFVVGHALGSFIAVKIKSLRGVAQ